MRGKHTPGIWSLNSKQTIPPLVESGEERPDDFGEMLRVPVAAALTGFKETDETAANARLIAAAPELLDACYEAVGALVTLQGEHSWVGEVLEAIKAAVRKAVDHAG
jgi:hypothetical protein